MFLSSRFRIRFSSSDGKVLPLMMLVVLLATACSSGCSKAEMKQALEEAKVKTQDLAASTQKAVEKHLPSSGEITLRTTPATKTTGRATLEVIAIGNGRPNVVQVTSYDPANSSKDYPAILLHGTTDASSVSALAGKTVSCDVYLHASRTSAVAMTGPGQSAQLTFTSINSDDQTIKATIGAVQLVTSDGKAVSVQGGDLLAVVREGGN
ncbi:hypothetical protein [Rubripirellula reticaptiva]|uniref:Uncharacterized protein n=1 Tax=Rubripirellula reticaptiva TaxID=2528013 RepID=A0A5C6F964_9BACT|nr:hypothetical protein [Rubripirellula reticaptiva]TWU58283.1 hypothetical protein Poly59_11940 [Rubripirellula reticaptiva]